MALSNSALSSFWRALLAAAILGAAALYPLQFTLIPSSGTFGFSTDRPFANAPEVTPRVTDVAKNSPAWRAGIRAGDELPLAHVNRASRIALLYTLPGKTARYDVARGAQAFTAYLRAVPRTMPPLGVEDVIRAVVTYSILLFALLVVLRAWNTPYGPLIATFLAAGGLDAAADRVPWTAATSGPLAATFFGINGLFDDGCTAVELFAAAFIAGSIIGWRSEIYAWTMRAVSALSVAVVVASPIGLYLRHTGASGQLAELMNDWLLNTLPFLAGALATLVAFSVSGGEARGRLRWMFWGFFPYFLGVGLINAGASLDLFSNTQVVSTIFRAMELALPLALFYGVLLRRAVDIGFVLNRVAVYGILSIVLVAIFVVLEDAAGRYLLEVGRAESLAIQLAVALTIGFSGRYLHKVVDGVVDRVLFAKRHADELALRRFAREAESYLSIEPLLDGALDVLVRHTESRGIGVFLVDGPVATLVRSSDAEMPASVPVDDPALVSMRTWNEPVDSHDVTTLFPDGMIFPIGARGSVLGALACRTKRDYSAFDPDERASIDAVARGAGAALTGLLTVQGDGVASLHASMAELTNAVSALGKKIDALRLEV